MTCQGPTLQWLMIASGARLCRVHGCQTASGGGLEAGGGLVQAAQQPADLPDLLLGVGTRMKNPPRDPGQDLPSLVVVAVTDHPRGGREAHLL
jgi:hypothetical protein